MLHQQVANFGCLPFGAGQAANSGILELCVWNQQPAVPENEVDDSSKTEPEH